MTESREGKSADDDLRVELEVNSQLDKDVSYSPAIAASMTKSQQMMI